MSDRLTILVIMGTRTGAHSLRSQVGMGSESDCLFGQFDRILCISDSEAGVKVGKTGGVAGEGRCGQVVERLLARDRLSLDILSVKKEAKLSASETSGAEEGKGEEDLRCSRLLTVCQAAWACEKMKRQGWSSSASWQ